MPEYLAPGVYVEERDTGAKAIEGVSTTTTGFVGVTERGVVGVPTLVIGTADYQRKFGDLLDRRTYTGDTWYLPHAVEGFFTNGGKRLYIVRVTSPGAGPAKATLFDRGKPGGTDTELAAGARAGDQSIVVTDTTGISVGAWLKVSDEDLTEQVKVASLNNTVRAARGAFRFDHGVGQAATVVNANYGAGDSLKNKADAGATSLVLNAAIVVVADEIIEVADGGLHDYVVVASAAGATITLKQGLLHDFPVNATVKKVTSFTAGTPTKLSAAVKAGDSLFTVELGTGFNAGVVVEVKGATVEYREIDPVDGARFSSGVRRSHAPGTEVTIVTPATADTTATTDIGNPTKKDIKVAAAIATLAANDFIVVGNPASADAEVAEVASHAAMDIKLKADLTKTHAMAETVRETRSITSAVKAGGTTVKLHDVTGITDASLLEIGLGATREIADVSAVDAPNNTVTLSDPLLFDHAAGSSATLVTLTPGTKTTLASSLVAGNRVLLVSDTAAYAAGTVLKVNGTGTEYRIVDGLLPNIGALGLDAPIEQIHGSEADILGRSPMINVEAIDAGEWGNAVRVTVQDEETPLLNTVADAGGANLGDPILKLKTAVGIEKGTVLKIGNQYVKASGAGPNRALFDAPGLPFSVAAGEKVTTQEFRVIVEILKKNMATGKYRVVQSEVHRQLTMDPDHSRFFARIIGRIYVDDVTTPLRADGRTQGESELIRVSDVATEAVARATIRLGPDITIDLLPDDRKLYVPTPLRGGKDDIGTVDDTTYLGVDDVDPKKRKGLHALQNIDDISLVAIPGRTGQALQQALLNHCELMRYRFAVLDAGAKDKVGDVQVHRTRYDSKYGALYYPWVRITDPFPDNPAIGGDIPVPSTGHVLGIYARSDIERGVHKAPANEVVRGIVGLEATLAKAEQDVLNPKGINVIRDFSGSLRGRRVWGARTVSSDPDWKYINVRRTFIYIEHSIDIGTQWVVFEPNSELLWQRVVRVIRAFLLQVWKDGALMGVKPEEAFYVKCDRTTMTQNDIDNGRLIVEIGVAVVKPAEFVIFRIGQWTASTEQA